MKNLGRKYIQSLIITRCHFKVYRSVPGRTQATSMCDNVNMELDEIKQCIRNISNPNREINQTNI